MRIERFKIILLATSIFIFACSNPGEKKNKEKTIRQKLSSSEIYSKKVNASCTILTDIGQGSGFFIYNNIVATNYHVIENSTYASIILNNDSKQYNIIGFLAFDRINDVILLLVDYSNDNIFTIEEKIPDPGDKVCSISSPIGLTSTISDGIISGKRNFEGRTLIQITAPISYGSSGSPIINEFGDLVGMAVGGIEEGNNLNFCIPTTYITNLLNFKNSYPTDLNKLKINSVSKKESSQETTTKEKPGSINNSPNEKNQTTNIDFKNKYSICKNNAARNTMISWVKNKTLLDYQINFSSFEVYEYEHSFKRPGWADSKCLKYLVTFEGTNNEGTRYFEEAFNTYYEHTGSWSFKMDSKLSSNWNMKDNIRCD
jgi:hypothetical protein